MTDTDIIKIVNNVGLPTIAQLIYKSSPYNAVDVLAGARASGKSIGTIKALEQSIEIQEIVNKHRQRYVLYNADGFLRCKEMIIYQPGFEDELLEHTEQVKQIIYRLLTSFARNVCKELDTEVPILKTWSSIYAKIKEKLQELLC